MIRHRGGPAAGVRAARAVYLSVVCTAVVVASAGAGLLLALVLVDCLPGLLMIGATR